MYYDSQSKEGKSEEELKNYSSKFYYYEDNSNELPKIKFVSINKEYSNFEMEANVDSYIWKDDYIYINPHYLYVSNDILINFLIDE